MKKKKDIKKQKEDKLEEYIKKFDWLWENNTFLVNNNKIRIY